MSFLKEPAATIEQTIISRGWEIPVYAFNHIGDYWADIMIKCETPEQERWCENVRYDGSPTNCVAVIAEMADQYAKTGETWKAAKLYELAGAIKGATYDL